MTREEALKRLEEWKFIRTTRVWDDLMKGVEALLAVHILVLRKSKDEKKIFYSQGAADVASVLLHAEENQTKEATDIIEGKKRTTADAARFS